MSARHRWEWPRSARVATAAVAVLAAATAWSGGASAQTTARTAPLIASTGDSVIPGQYVVVLDDSVDGAQRASVTSLVTATGGTVRFSYTAALNGFSATLPPAALAAVRAAADVRYVEADTWVSLPAGELPATGLAPAKPIWNLDRMDQRALPLSETYAPPWRGAGVTAYVIDTGIWFTHPEFEDRASSGYDFVDDDADALDCNGHGTHVAGTIAGELYGVANAAEVVALRVLGCNGSGPKSQVIAGVDWVTAHAQKPAVANMSLGGKPSRAEDEAVTNSIRSGVTYTVAAGNEAQPACNRSPARTKAALTVGATDNTDTQWELSNYGSCLDLYAPGVLIRSAWPSDTGVTNTISGTSMAAPHVAGTAAVYLAAHPAATPQQVRRAVVGQATEGALSGLGPESPNLLAYVRIG